MDRTLDFDCYSLRGQDYNRAWSKKSTQRVPGALPPKLLFQKLRLGEVFRPYLTEVFELLQKLEVNVGATWNFATTRKNIREAFNVK